MGPERAAPAYVHVLDGAWRGPGRARQLAELAWALARTRISAHYRRSALGVLWAVLQPLGYLLLFLFLRGIFGASGGAVPFALSACCGLVLWTFFSSAILRIAPSVLNNRGIVKKVALARGAFPTSGLLVAGVDLAIAWLLLAALLALFAASGRFEPLFGTALLYVPVLVLATGLLALGIGMLAAAVGTYRQDAILALPFLMQFWLLATPLLYRSDEVPERWQAWCSLNPMVGLVEGFRGAILENRAPELGALGLSALSIGLVWAVAAPVYARASRSFADVL